MEEYAAVTWLRPEVAGKGMIHPLGNLLPFTAVFLNQQSVSVPCMMCSEDASLHK